MYSPKQSVLLAILYMSVEFHAIFSILGMMKYTGLCEGLKQS